MSSERLPGKVLRTISDIPLLEYQLTRLCESGIFRVVVATSDLEADQALADYCQQHHHMVFRGDEQNVLKRFYDCAHALNLGPDSKIVRLTGDCPLSCPDLIVNLSRHYEATSSDYVRIDTATYPRGVDAELFTFAMLIEANETADTSFEQEHVTPYFYQSGRYRVSHLKNPLGNHASYRLCVDEMADFKCVTEVIRNLGDNWASATYEDIIRVLEANPEIANINRTVKQR
jgi:spore coat polysaccharide biosynthesis protein SpsF (cytidylyltransferase family)